MVGARGFEPAIFAPARMQRKCRGFVMKDIIHNLATKKLLTEILVAEEGFEPPTRGL